MECRYSECDNQSLITLEGVTAFQPIRTQESSHVIKANNILCILTYFSTRNLCKNIINIRPTSKGALCLVSTLISDWVSAFRRPYGPCPQTDTRPDTRVDTRPRTPFSVSLIYIYKQKDPTCAVTIVLPDSIGANIGVEAGVTRGCKPNLASEGCLLNRRTLKNGLICIDVWCRRTTHRTCHKSIWYKILKNSNNE